MTDRGSLRESEPPRRGRDADHDSGPVAPAPTEPRPWLERIGLAAIALVMGAMLTLMGVVAWIGGEWILAAMSAAGAVLTIGVGLLTLLRG